MLFGLLLAASAPDCPLPMGALVAKAKTARAIAEAVIAERELPKMRAHYVLHINPPTADDPNGWQAGQALKNFHGFGGGGLVMRIDRCTGEISQAYFLR